MAHAENAKNAGLKGGIAESPSAGRGESSRVKNEGETAGSGEPDRLSRHPICGPEFTPKDARGRQLTDSSHAHTYMRRNVRDAERKKQNFCTTAINRMFPRSCREGPLF